MAGKGILQVDYELLHMLLKLDDDIEITGVFESRGDYIVDGNCYFRVQGTGLPGNGLFSAQKPGLFAEVVKL